MLSAVRLLAGMAVLLLGAGAAHAAGDDRALLARLRDCAKIPTLAERAGCYDAILRPEPVAAARPGAAAPSPSRSQGFGGETLRDRPRPQQADVSYTGRVAAISERQPGLYRITLEDGAEWQFASSAGFAYEPPRKGAIVEIRRAALGSFLLRFDAQVPVRVVRLR